MDRLLEAESELCLEIPVSGHAGCGDLAEAGGIDIQVRVPQNRFVQHIPRIQSKLHTLAFQSSLIVLLMLMIETETAGTCDPACAEIADLSGRRILQKNVALDASAMARMRACGLQALQLALRWRTADP